MKIGLQNFQGITNYQEIELAPLTLIYGPNSAGKSTLVDAMDVGRHLYERAGNALPYEWHAARPDIQDRNSVTTVIEFGDIEFNQYHFEFADWLFDSGCHQDVYDAQDVLSHISGYLVKSESGGNNAKLACRYEWRLDGNRCRLSAYVVTIDSIWVLRWKRYTDEADGGITPGCFEINKRHPLMLHIKSNFDIWGGNKLNLNHDDFVASFEDGIDSFTGSFPELLINGFDYVLNSIVNEPLPAVLTFLIAGCTALISETCNEMLVPPIRPTEIDENEWGEVRAEIKQKYLSEYGSEPASEAKLIAHAFEQGSSFDSAVDGSGKSKLDDWNEVLSSPLFLDTGFKLTGDVYLTIPSNTLDELLNSDKSERRKIIEESAEIVVKPKLFDCRRNYDVAIHDVGVGISQVVPVVVASAGKRAHIQQPELHLHPKMQARIYLQRNLFHGQSSDLCALQ